MMNGEAKERPRARKSFTFNKTALARAYDLYEAIIEEREKFFLFYSSFSVHLEDADRSQ